MKKSLLVKSAEVISILLNPFLLGLVIVVMAVLKSKMPSQLQSAWLIAIVILNGGILTLVYLFLVKKGYVFDESMDNKKILHGRIVLLLILLTMVTLELLVLVSTTVYQPLLAVFYGAVITILLGLIITSFWKISWHSTMITFFTAMLVIIYKWKVWPVTVLFILIVWSRLILKRHNIWQLLGGVTLSIIVMLGVFAYFGLLS